MSLEDVRAALPVALPVMMGYLAIGVPCGVMAAEAGLSPLAVFLLSALIRRIVLILSTAVPSPLILSAACCERKQHDKAHTCRENLSPI